MLNGIKTALYSAKIAAKVHSPELKVGAAFAVGTTGVVLACIAAYKSRPIVEDAKEAKAAISGKYGLLEASEAKEQLPAVTYKAFKSEIKRIDGYSVKNCLRLYLLPGILLSTASVLYISAFTEVKSRYVGAMATAAAFQTALEKYRERVAGAIGADKESDLYNGITRKDIEVVDENGKKVKVKNAPVQEDTAIFGPLAVEWSDYDPATHKGSKHYDGRSDYDLRVLKLAQANANTVLKARGTCMTLAEVLDGYLSMRPESLIIDDPSLAYSWGWRYTPDDTDSTSDNFIDFGIWDKNGNWADGAVEEFASGRSAHNLLLKFNAVPLMAVDNTVENKISDALKTEVIDQK